MEEEEDILDLTAELGGLEPVEETMVAEVVEMVEMVAEAAPAEAVAAEAPPSGSLSTGARAASSSRPAGAGARASRPRSHRRRQCRRAMKPPPRWSAPLPPCGLASFPPHSQSSPRAPAPVFQTQPLPEPVTAPEPVAAVAEPQLELTPEPEVVLAEFEAELVIEEPVVVEAVESERQLAPAWEADAPSFAAAVEREASLRPRGPTGITTMPPPLQEPWRTASRTCCVRCSANGSMRTWPGC